jgi:hypothetical protein
MTIAATAAALRLDATMTPLPLPLGHRMKHITRHASGAGKKFPALRTERPCLLVIRRTTLICEGHPAQNG